MTKVVYKRIDKLRQVLIHEKELDMNLLDLSDKPDKIVSSVKYLLRAMYDNMEDLLYVNNAFVYETLKEVYDKGVESKHLIQTITQLLNTPPDLKPDVPHEMRDYLQAIMPYIRPFCKMRYVLLYCAGVSLPKFTMLLTDTVAVDDYLSNAVEVREYISALSNGAHLLSTLPDEENYIE